MGQFKLISSGSNWD